VLRAYAKELIRRDKAEKQAAGIGTAGQKNNAAGKENENTVSDVMSEFIEKLPHDYFDENQLHAFIISELKDYEKCISEVRRFLPYVDNWATCDQLSPNVFKNNKPAMLKEIKKWLGSDETYTVRFAVGMLMRHYLDEDFDESYPKMVAAVRSDEYYIKMMIAWYFATALAKQYDTVLAYIEEQRLDIWTHNKAIQKSVESRRITEKQKIYLKSLKVVSSRQQMSTNIC
jgi:3-methyladenine DNA glycosylase AlkD